MLTQILNFIKIRQEMPDAFGYELRHTRKVPRLPDDIVSDIPAELIDKIKRLTTTVLSIDNYSNQTKRDVRVFFSGNFSFKPNIYFNHPSDELINGVEFKQWEITLAEIPPYESVFIELYNISDDFSVDKVVVEDQRVTPVMQKLASLKRYPDLTRMNLRLSIFTVITLLLAVLTFCYSGYTLWNYNKKQEIFDKAYGQYESCLPEIFDNSIEKEKELERKFHQLGQWGRFTLDLNKVQDLESLKLKDTVVLCVPKNK